MATYEKRQDPVFKALEHRIKGFAGEQREWAKKIYDCLPVPLGGDISLKDVIDFFEPSIEKLRLALKKSSNSITTAEAHLLRGNDYTEYTKNLLKTDSPEFKEFYNTLLYLRERMQMPVSRLVMMENVINSISKAKTESGAGPSSELLKFAEDCLKFSNALTFDQGNLSAPTSPQSTREKVEEVYQAVNSEGLTPLVKAVLTFVRFIKPIETLTQFCIQHSQVRPERSSAIPEIDPVIALAVDRSLADIGELAGIERKPKLKL